VSIGRYAERSEAGSSLLEVVVGLCVSTLVMVYGLVVFRELAQVVERLSDLIGVREQVSLAPALLSSWTLGCGSGLPTGDGLSVEDDRVSLRGDIDGSGGFPDTVLDDPFEAVEIMAGGDSLRIRSGQGSWQPMLDGVAAVTFSRPSAGLLEVGLEVVGRRAPGLSRRHTVMYFHLPNLMEAEGP